MSTSEKPDPMHSVLPHRQQSGAKRLGRGLGALLGEAKREEPLVEVRPGMGGTYAPATGSKSGLATLSIASIEPHPDQPRRYFDEAALAELAASIDARGVIQPVIVRPLENGRYQLVAG